MVRQIPELVLAECRTSRKLVAELLLLARNKLREVPVVLSPLRMELLEVAVGHMPAPGTIEALLQTRGALRDALRRSREAGFSLAAPGLVALRADAHGLVEALHTRKVLVGRLQALQRHTSAAVAHVLLDCGVESLEAAGLSELLEERQHSLNALRRREKTAAGFVALCEQVGCKGTERLRHFTADEDELSEALARRRWYVENLEEVDYAAMAQFL